MEKPSLDGSDVLLSDYGIILYHSVRKVSDIYFFFCEILVDYNEVRLHEGILNLHIQAWIIIFFKCISLLYIFDIIQYQIVFAMIFFTH